MQKYWIQHNIWCTSSFSVNVSVKNSLSLPKTWRGNLLITVHQPTSSNTFFKGDRWSKTHDRSLIFTVWEKWSLKIVYKRWLLLVSYFVGCNFVNHTAVFRTAPSTPGLPNRRGGPVGSRPSTMQLHRLAKSAGSGNCLGLAAQLSHYRRSNSAPSPLDSEPVIAGTSRSEVYLKVTFVCFSDDIHCIEYIIEVLLWSCWGS